MTSTEAVRQMRQRTIDKAAVDAVFVDPYNRTLELVRLPIKIADDGEIGVADDRRYDELGPFEVEAMTGESVTLHSMVVGPAGPETPAADRRWEAMTYAPNEVAIRNDPSFDMAPLNVEGDYYAIRGRAYVVHVVEPHDHGMPSFVVDTTVEEVLADLWWIEPSAEPDIVKQVVVRAKCVVCGAPHKSKCGKCMLARYCGPECQLQDWRRHRAVCKPTLAR